VQGDAVVERKNNIIDELEKAGAETAAFYKSLTPDKLDVLVYTEEVQWTVRQLLAHFITIEQSMQWLFRNILKGGLGSPENFDLDHFNRTQPAKLDGLSLEELLDRFKAVRRETIAIVAGMVEADFDRTGRHAFHGHGKLERFIRWAYEHQRLHIEDIHKALGFAKK